MNSKFLQKTKKPRKICKAFFGVGDEGFQNRPSRLLCIGML